VSTPSGSGPRPRFGERPVMATDGRGLKKSFLSFPYPSFPYLSFPYPSFPYPVEERITQYSASPRSQTPFGNALRRNSVLYSFQTSLVENARSANVFVRDDWRWRPEIRCASSLFTSMIGMLSAF
jgi:hypothetical protein